jgi:hypothetical protein
MDRPQRIGDATNNGGRFPLPTGVGAHGVRPYENKTQLLDRMAISIVIGNQEGHGMPCPYKPRY